LDTEPRELQLQLQTVGAPATDRGFFDNGAALLRPTCIAS